MISAWILYGVVASQTIGTTDVILVNPVLFKTELQCLKNKDKNEQNLKQKYDRVEVRCIKEIIHD